MIPLRVYRLVGLLLAVSAALAFIDGVFYYLVLPAQLSRTLSGALGGLLVFLLAHHGGRLLLFCGRGMVDDANRSQIVHEALLELGVMGERRQRPRPSEKPLAANRAIYVSIVDSPRFIAITVQSGQKHRTFVSTGLVDALSPGALRGVLAHEYGHVENAHPAKQGLVLGAVAAIKMSVGIPLGAAIVLLLAYLYMLREWEYVADARAVRHAGRSNVLCAFGEYQAIHGGKDMGVVSEFFCGHPSFSKRVRAIQQNLV